MMNLDEILRGIGSQMANAVPHWTDAVAGPQQQPGSWTDMLGSFGQAVGSWTDALPGNSRAGNPGNWTDALPRGAAMGHVQAAKQQPAAQNYQTGTPAGNDAEIQQYITEAAAQHHIDPSVAQRVWANEGRSNYIGDNGSSFGPFQLHYGNVAGGGNAVGGLGDAFTKATGLDARDPATWRAQVDWSLDQAAQGGWGPWHGHIGNPMEGIGTYYGGTPAQAAPGAQAQSGLVGLLEQGGHKLGEKYDWGGAGQPGRGFDCSGLVSWLGQQYGIPGVSSRETTFSLFPKTQQIDEASAQPGDLVFYNMNSSDPHMQHVAIYMGGGKILQSGGAQADVNVGDAHQAIGSAPIFRRLPGLSEAVAGGNVAQAPAAQPGAYMNQAQWR